MKERKPSKERNFIIYSIDNLEFKCFIENCKEKPAYILQERKNPQNTFILCQYDYNHFEFY